LPDVVEKVKAERGLLEKVISYIPGYHGYKEKELRRESDRLVRQQAASYVKRASDSFKRSLASGPNLTDAKRAAADRLLARLDLTKERISKAVGGYSGFFDAVKVREDKLDRMTTNDLDLINLCSALTDQINKVAKAGSASSGWAQLVEEAESQIDEIEGALRTRDDILTKV
jgi:hypothetical protein